MNETTHRLQRAWSGYGQRFRWAVVLACLAGASGCAPSATPTMRILGSEARRTLEAGFTFEANPAIRAQAIEGGAEVLEDASPLIRERLDDPVPGVRFAACMALGDLRDKDAVNALRKRTQDEDRSVRVAAYFALERIGHPDYRRQWRDALLKAQRPEVRRNAALALGRLGNKAVIPLLTRASIEDDDDGVRLQARESMALLGDPDSISRFVHDAYGGMGFRQPFAVLTLGQVKDPSVLPVLRRCLETSPYREAQLAAARSLGMHGYPNGYDIALNSLRWNDPVRDLPDDPPENQVRRVRVMAIMALGEIGQIEAQEPLARQLAEAKDPEIQLAAAVAILKIYQAQGVAIPPALEPISGTGPVG